MIIKTEIGNPFREIGCQNVTETLENVAKPLKIKARPGESITTTERTLKERQAKVSSSLIIIFIKLI